MSKAGTSRIPTFGSRIPQVSTQPKSLEITSKQLGKRVRVGEKEGVLKFVGNVHFSKGVWCGVELSNSIGKNDGIVNGVRYFVCASRRGLMAPLSKVSLVQGSCESLHDEASGPYSMLFIEPKLPAVKNSQSSNAVDLDRTVCVSNEESHSNTFSRKDNNETLICNQRKYVDNSCDILSTFSSSTSSDELSQTVIKKANETYNTQQQQEVFNTNLNETYKNLNETINNEIVNNCTFEKDSTKKILTENNETYNAGRRRTYGVDVVSTTFDIENNKKRSNTTFDVSSGDLETTIINLSPTAENRTFKTEEDSVLAEKSFSINKSCEALLNESGVEVKRRRTSNPKNQKIDALILRTLPDPIDKPSSLPQLRSSINVSSPPLTSLNKFSQSTPSRGEFTESLLWKLRLSSVGAAGSDRSTNYDDDSSKRDSLECEESLGILTPDQMVDNMVFASMQPRSLSLECEGIAEFTNKMQEPGRKSELSSPKDASLGILDEKVLNITVRNSKGLILDVPASKDAKDSELPSPNLNSTTDYSLGIIDEQILSNFTLKTDTTANMELLLGALDKSKEFALTRLDQTPSPEELPLDPTPIIESENSKTESCKSKTTSSFITSITSITSLDTGYQGDGEMSRPASRGADNSPLTKRPLPRPPARRPDPMTDSDFYTESDADNHEDNQLRGDRRAQVIDGTLYGVDPQAAADIYVNNRENMDSSGIFTDLESNTRNDEDLTPNEVPDVSPSDTSSKTISENSQSNLQEVLDKGSTKNEKKNVERTPQKDNPKKRNAPSPGLSSPSSISSPKHVSKEENALKKYKMPKRDVSSKVKAMLEPQVQQVEKKTVKKPVGRWDAVMNKISKNEQNKTNLKEVKSKVFNNTNVKKLSAQRQTERKPNVKPPGNQKSPNNKTPTVPKIVISHTNRSPDQTNYFSPPKLTPKWSPRCKAQTTPNRRLEPKPRLAISEPRRIRNRTSASSTPKNIGSNIESSIHSSLSDLSAATIPPKTTIGSAKKRDVVQVTQVLTANKLSPRNQQQHTTAESNNLLILTSGRQQQQNAAENKKNAALHPSSSNEYKSRRAIFSPKDKKQATTKECGRGTVKGGRTSPSVRPPTQTRAPAKQQVPRVAEALAVLVQHLVFNVEAYQVPTLRRQVEKFRLEAEEIRLACQHLEETLADERAKHARAIEEERVRCRNDIAELIEKHRSQVTQLNKQHAELEQCLRADKENVHHNLSKQHDEALATLRKEYEKLQRTHAEALDILREENESIREQIDEKRLEVEKANHESMKLKKDYESKEVILKEQNLKLKVEFEERVKGLVEENKRLREENDRLLSYGDDKGIGIQEVQSLRAVLELKQNEVAELRKNLAEKTQQAEILVDAEKKARVLNARCEDLELQLQRKNEHEQNLLQEHQKLQESFKEETNQKRRLYQQNEELQWKIKQNKEVVSKVLEQTEDAAFNRSLLLSSSFNERHNSTKLNVERAMSFRERTYSNKSNISVEDTVRMRKSKNSLEFEMEDVSPPASPKVKGVVEKCDSVSYVLDLDESPEVVASRIVRRSFRNTTPPKNTPTKSPCTKRPRIRNPLSQSASSSAIITGHRNELDRPRSASVRNGECENDVFLWTTSVCSTPNTYKPKLDESCESSNSSLKLEDHLDLDEDHEVDIQLPALPSELDRRMGVQALPSPKHLAGEAMISESNSEDESTSSSQL